MEKIDKFLNKNDAENIIDKINELHDNIKSKIENDKIIFEEEDEISTDIVEINLGNYSVSLLTYNFGGYNWMWENCKFEQFQNRNFFLEKDLSYLKCLIKKYTII